MRLLLGVAIVAIASSCVSRADRVESRTLDLERDSSIAVSRVLTDHYGITDYYCGTRGSNRPPNAHPNVGVDWSRNPRIERKELRRIRLESQARQLRTCLGHDPQFSNAPLFFTPLPSSCATWGSCALVVREAHRDPESLGRVRELVARLDVGAGDD